MDMGYDTQMMRGWFWDAELLLRGQKEGYSIKEFPVFWEAGKQSSFNFGRELRIIRYLPKVYASIGRIQKGNNERQAMFNSLQHTEAVQHFASGESILKQTSTDEEK